jgi:ATP-dependent Clp protease ATP-binding subunit ClpC
MILRKGKDTIGGYKGATLVVDWDKLFAYRGGRFGLNRLERTSGYVLQLISLLGLVVIILFEFSSGRVAFVSLLRPNNPATLFAWCFLLLFTYAKYLLRSRARFEDTKATHTLKQMREENWQATEVDISQLFSYRTKVLLDTAYFSGNNFIGQLKSQLVRNSYCTEILSRLGIEGYAIDSVLVTAEVDATFDTTHQVIFTTAFEAAIAMESDYIDYAHILLALLHGIWRNQILAIGITENDINGMYLWLASVEKKNRYLKLWQEKAVLKPTGVMNRAYTSVYAENLEQYGRDYTRESAKGVFQLAIGRDRELNDVITGLRYSGGSATLLISKPGVGKTQLLRHLSVKMVVEDVPPELRDKRLVAFEFNEAFSKLGSVEEFKALAQSIFEEVAISKYIILVLDDFDQLLNIRSDISAEVINLVVSAISNYQIPIIATVSEDGYRKYIQTNPTLVNAFRVVRMEEPQEHLSLQIISDELLGLERKYGCRVQYAAVKLLVNLSYKVSLDRAMPSKALQLLEEIFITAQSQGKSVIDSAFVSAYVSQKIGVNVGTLSASEAEKLIGLEDKMHGRVVGQDTAVSAIASALRRSRAGLGKSSKTLAETYYGDEKSMVRLDMSEYQEQANLDRLIGKQSGNEFSGGFLTEAVRTRPFSLLLLDELEKANPKVLDLFLQILDDGFITDGLGRRVDFTNTIIIATSNAASKEIAEGILSGVDYNQVYESTVPILRTVYRVEFLNRFDKVIMFKPLVDGEVKQVIVKFLGELIRKLAERGITMQYQENLLTDLARLGYNPIYGARELNRIIQDQIETRVADAIIGGKLTSGKTIIFASLDNIDVV